MTKQLTLEEWLFGLGIYPSLNAVEKFGLFIEMLGTLNEDSYIQKYVEKFHLELDTKKIKKLSQKRKASFASFLQATSISNEMKRYQKHNINWTHLFSENYPHSLRQIYSPPVVLFYKGNIEDIEKKIWLGVVGARQCTNYGLKAVEEIIPSLLSHTAHQVGIVSGLAKGIDTKAHREAINHQGSTIGVIGSGLDVTYPAENKQLQEKMAKEQLILSEYPLGAKPLKFHFPERNRIIAGLSRGVLVIEAKKRSGSLITAYNALDENRDVFAVPGSIFESKRAGCHKLIKLGAVLTQNSKDILEEWFII